MRWSIDKILPAAIATVAAVAMMIWWFSAPEIVLPVRVPGRDRADLPVDAAGAEALQGELVAGHGQPSDLPGEWPNFRGINLDGISVEDVPLARRWSGGAPPEFWGVDVGEGYAGAAIKDGCVFLTDYDMEKQADALRCFSLADGQEIWRYSYPVKVKRNHGMTRTTPAVTDRFVVSFGPKCHVLCVDVKTGEKKWMIDLVAEYGSKVPPWYAGQCPLIEDNRVIIAPSGTQAVIMALDLETGEVLWETPNTLGWRMTHVSITPVEMFGKRTYVYCGSGGVAGFDAEDGTLLWSTDAWKISVATVSSPVPVGDNMLFMSGGYNAGAKMLKIAEQDGQLAADVVYELPPEEFGATQQTPIYYEGFIYGVRPDGQLTCLSPDGSIKWTSGAAARFGIGPFIIADGLIYVLDDDGNLTMAETTPDGYKPLGTASILSGHDAWGPLAIAGGRLVARDLTRMVCVNLAQ
ncbi:MAG: outer membrane protein assembly factor BamB family protein [Planctomycetota bacterium]|jgi:outer membrane protein assembly factor BamB